MEIVKVKKQIAKNWIWITNKWIGNYELDLYSTPTSFETNKYYISVRKYNRKEGGYFRKRLLFEIKAKRNIVETFFMKSTLLDYL